jgi:hypothetical protein
MATGSTLMMPCMFRILIIFAFASALLRTKVQLDTVAPLSRTTGFANISGGLARSVMQTFSLAHVTTGHHCLLTTGGHTIPRPLRDTLHAVQPNQVLRFDFFYGAEPTADTLQQYKYVLVIMDGFPASLNYI